MSFDLNGMSGFVYEGNQIGQVNSETLEESYLRNIGNFTNYVRRSDIDDFGSLHS